MQENERELIKKAKKADTKAFEELIEPLQKKVFNIALRMLDNREDAYEMSQEAFIKAYRAINGFKEESSFSTWVYKIVSNICLDEIRKRKNRKIVLLDESLKGEENDFYRSIEDHRPTPDIVTERREVREVINEAINTLPKEQRLVIILRDIQGFSYEEITNITNWSAGTVKSRINRARLGLREILSDKKELFFERYVK